MLTATRTGEDSYRIALTNDAARERRHYMHEFESELAIKRGLDYKPTRLPSSYNPKGARCASSEHERRMVAQFVSSCPTGIVREWRVGGSSLSGVTHSSDGRHVWFGYDSESGRFVTAEEIPNIQEYTIRKSACGRRGDSVRRGKVFGKS